MLASLAGNFVYQFFSDAQYAIAAERAYFQIIAIAMFWIVFGRTA